MKHISILGSTGSIGKQTLDIVREQKDIQVHGISANKNIAMLEEQIAFLQPRLCAVMDPDAANVLRKKIEGKYPDTEVVSGMEGLIAVATMEEIDMVVTAVVGMIGLKPTVEAIKAGKHIGLANKETLVTAGELIMPMIKDYGVSLLPVDSEHSAIFQSMNGESQVSIEKILLTASGGPFRNKSKEDIEKAELEDALKHPNWSMGAKITIDSATMMNKGLEVIEAKWLFDVPLNAIDVVVHPQSIIHSMVQYQDGSVIGQLGLPDMKLPIQYALYYPERRANGFKRMDLATISTLTFEKPDFDKFPCLSYAYEALRIGGTMPTVLNAANERAVALFLEKKIRFTDIPKMIHGAMKAHKPVPVTSIDVILETEAWSHQQVDAMVEGL